jgi:hypothetical protein
MSVPKRLPASLRGLRDFINWIDKFYDVSQLTILEVGSWAGCSANEFAQRFKVVYCVDPWETQKNSLITVHNDVHEAEKEFEKVKAKYDNVFKIRHRIEDFINELEDKSIDIIYIDGIHTYKAVKRDIELCLPKCKLFISGHDYWRGKFDGVIQAVNEKFGRPDHTFPDRSWIYKLERNK